MSIANRLNNWISPIADIVSTLGMVLFLMLASFIGGMVLKGQLDNGTRLITITDLKNELAHEQEFQKWNAELEKLRQHPRQP